MTNRLRLFFLCALVSLVSVPGLLAVPPTPEIDPSAAGGGLALAVGTAMLLWERRRRR